ncbi:hypothetical protein V8C34DRAFT_322234 [Trichoderma compactum]
MRNYRTGDLAISAVVGVAYARVGDGVITLGAADGRRFRYKKALPAGILKRFQNQQTQSTSIKQELTWQSLDSIQHLTRPPRLSQGYHYRKDDSCNGVVVTYSSEAQSRANLSFLDDLSHNGGKDYEKWTAYSNSKACHVLLSVGLVQHFGRRGLRSFSVDPDVVVTTGLTRSVPMEDFQALGMFLTGNLDSAIKAKTLAEGSSTGIIAAFDSRLSNKDGYYLADGVLTREGLLPGAVDAAEAEKLWRISEALAKHPLSVSQVLHEI